MRRLFSYLLILVAAGCGTMHRPVYRIGVDPSFYPQHLMGKEANMVAFTSDLLKEIALQEGVTFVRVSKSWDNLLLGLREGEYDACFSSVEPYVFNQGMYDFSKAIVETGPVLVTMQGSPVDSLESATDREIGVYSREDEAIIVEHNPEVIIRFYDSQTAIFSQLERGELDGALIPALVAKTFVQDRYSNSLHVTSNVLSQDGIRLVTRHGEHEELLKLCNRALAKLRRKGVYKKLADKWGIAS